MEQDLNSNTSIYLPALSLLFLLAWQLFLVIMVFQVNGLFEEMQLTGKATYLIKWGQPILWLFPLVTFWMLIRTFRSKSFRSNKVFIYIIGIGICTMLLHWLAVYGAYTPIFSLSPNAE